MEKLRQIKIVSANNEIVQIDFGHHPDMRIRTYDACGNDLNSQRIIELYEEVISKMEIGKGVERFLNNKEG